MTVKVAHRPRVTRVGAFWQSACPCGWVADWTVWANALLVALSHATPIGEEF